MRSGGGGGETASRYLSGLEKGGAGVGKTEEVVFVGFADFEMDGRVHTAGEMDRLMMFAAAAKYPCCRPATLAEYAEGRVSGLPARNISGRDLVFIGAGATGCELSHTNTLGSQKATVLAGGDLDGRCSFASLHGRKSILCIYPLHRVKKQKSLTQFGLAKSSLDKSMTATRRSASLTSLGQSAQWALGQM